MRKKSGIDDQSRDALTKLDFKKLRKIEEKFLSENKGFFEFLEKFPPKDFEEYLNKYIGKSYLEFLKNYDSALYKKFISNESIGEYYQKDNNIFAMMNPNEVRIVNDGLKMLIDFDRSDQNEQKLFHDVWVINKNCNHKNIKFSPYATFKEINDKNKYIDSSLIQPSKFTTTSLYNRYKQYRKRQQKKNRK